MSCIFDSKSPFNTTKYSFLCTDCSSAVCKSLGGSHHPSNCDHFTHGDAYIEGPCPQPYYGTCCKESIVPIMPCRCDPATNMFPTPHRAWCEMGGGYWIPANAGNADEACEMCMSGELCDPVVVENGDGPKISSDVKSMTPSRLPDNFDINDWEKFINKDL